LKKPVLSAVPLHPVISERWSPRAFDVAHEISEDDLLGILEAGRWAPSANNFQPWRFIVAKRGDQNFAAITSTLAGFNQIWVPNVSVIIAIAAVIKNEDGSDRVVSHYDAGLAAGMMTIEAHHRGLAVHHVGGFDHAKLSTELALPSNTSPIILLAIGKQIPAEQVSDENLRAREVSPRERKPLADLILPGKN
jgi:nitroreductase